MTVYRNIFKLFLIVRHPELNIDDIIKYGAKEPPAALLKEFMLFSVRTSTAMLDDKVTITTAINTFRCWKSLWMHVAGTPLDRLVSKDVEAYVYSDLKS